MTQTADRLTTVSAADALAEDIDRLGEQRHTPDYMTPVFADELIVALGKRGVMAVTGIQKIRSGRDDGFRTMPIIEIFRPFQ